MIVSTADGKDLCVEMNRMFLRATTYVRSTIQRCRNVLVRTC